MNNRARPIGIAILSFAALAAILATGFKVSFPTDSLGPRAFPILSAFLIALGGMALTRPQEGTFEWPDGPATRRIFAATASFIAYALLLEPLGFVVATALEFSVLALLFGGRIQRSVLAGAAASLLLYALFVFGLGLPLPLGPFVR